MPQPSIILSEQELQEVLDKEPGIFAKDHTQGFREKTLKEHPKLALAELPEPKNHQDLWDNFRKFGAKKSTFDGNINSGLYIKIDDLMAKLTEFKTETDSKGKLKGLTHVYVSFGLRLARKNPLDEAQEMDWNCLHLILQGATPIAEFEQEPSLDAGSQAKSVTVLGEAKLTKKPTVVSQNRYSTYNGDERNYIGPKPGCPPFGAPQETE